MRWPFHRWRYDTPDRRACKTCGACQSRQVESLDQVFTWMDLGRPAGFFCDGRAALEQEGR